MGDEVDGAATLIAIAELWSPEDPSAAWMVRAIIDAYIAEDDDGP
ncbi:hypothetical protein [Nocardia sp. NPDC020380]